MKLATRICWLLVLGGLLLAPGVWAQAQTGNLYGTVTDVDDGLPLPGASVLIAGTAQGAATDVDGNYRITGLAAGTYTVIFSFIGYRNEEVEVQITAGQDTQLDVQMQAGVELDPIQVTAGRRQEKALDAPASIDVIGVREIEQDVGPSSVTALRNVTGVDMAQTGIDRREVVLRGFNNAFSGATYILTDYRQAAVPSLGVNIYSIMPNMSIDLEKVEVVRGPGSALYGAGVDAGVVHFFTKDPFRYPGVTVSVSGGEQSLINIQGRAAGVIGENLGVKVTGTYGSADDFELDPSDPIDMMQLDGDVITPRRNDFDKLNLNGTLEYRMGESTALIFNGGFSELTATVLSGIGTVQADGFGYTYGQVRFQSGAFFAQAYLNRNSAGDSFVYDTGLNVVDKGTLYNAQAQYDLSLADGREQIIIGVDLELTRPDTEGTILGRNENSDEIDEYGGYIQSTTILSDQLELTLAGRGDYNNVVEKFQVSPRVGLVFKPSPGHTVRATFNRAFSSPGTNSNFLDILAATSPLPVRGRGAGAGFTWERNPAFLQFGAPTDLVASSLNPASLGAPQPVGLPLDATYAAVYAGLAATPVADLTAALNAQGIMVPEQAVGQLVALLDPRLTVVSGLTPGNMGILDQTTGDIDFVNDLVNIDPLEQTTSQTFEVGYKGLINDRVLIAIDGYLTTKENFVGPLGMETPLVFVPNLQTDLATALAGGIAANDPLAAALAGLSAATGQDLSPATVAGLVVAFAGSQLPGPTTPVAIVQAAENNPGIGATPELMLSYRNFGKVTYYGIDASIQVLATDEISLFGNISWINDDFFDAEELEEDGTDLSLALNAPTFKAKFGGSYNDPSGVSINASGRYIKGFPVASGPYIGDLDNYFLIDLGAGYVFGQGLRLDVGVSNLLDDDHREFIGAPKLGRVAMGRVTYTFGAN